MCVDHVPSPGDNARNKVEHIYTGPMDTELAESMCKCDPDVSPSDRYTPHESGVASMCRPTGAVSQLRTQHPSTCAVTQRKAHLFWSRGAASPNRLCKNTGVWRFHASWISMSNSSVDETFRFVVCKSNAFLARAATK